MGTRIVSNELKSRRAEKTYAVRNLNMLDEHGHFLLRNKTLEVLPWLIGVHGLELGGHTIPFDTTSDGEQVRHQSSLAGNLNLDRAVAETANAAIGQVEAVTLNSPHGIVEGLKLDKGIHRLACDPLHDNVNGLFLIAKNLSRTAKKSDNFRALGREWDLKKMG